MKLSELLYKTPEMTEEKLLEIMSKNLDMFRVRNSSLIKRIQQLHRYSDGISNLLLKEFDIIQEKKSYLTKSQRELVTGFVGYCMILMTKGDEENKSETIPETEVLGNASE